MFYAYKLSLTKLHVIYKVPNIRERHYENTFEDRGLQCYSGVLNHSSLLTNIVINILMNPSNNFILKKIFKLPKYNRLYLPFLYGTLRGER